LGDRPLVDAVLEDYRTAPIDDRDRALFAFIEKMNAQSNRIGRDDIDRLKKAGWTEEAIYDAITVCALFRFYNAWIDATGVHDLPAAAYALSGKRMAGQGYMR
jgi:alkylhydroperoxidase family enzyme